MSTQPIQFLSDIGPGHQHRQFLGDALFRHRRREPSQLAEQSFEPGTDRRRLCCRGSCGGLDQHGELGPLRREQREKPRPLLAAGSGETVERDGPSLQHRGAAGLDHRLGIFLGALDDAANAEQAVEPRRRRLDLTAQFAE